MPIIFRSLIASTYFFSLWLLTRSFTKALLPAITVAG